MQVKTCGPEAALNSLGPGVKPGGSTRLVTVISTVGTGEEKGKGGQWNTDSEMTYTGRLREFTGQYRAIQLLCYRLHSGLIIVSRPEKTVVGIIAILKQITCL